MIVARIGTSFEADLVAATDKNYTRESERLQIGWLVFKVTVVTSVRARF